MEAKRGSFTSHRNSIRFGSGRKSGTTMSRLTAKDFPQELLDLYDYYAHGKITKREFLDRAGKYAVAGVTASAILASMSPNYALAQQVKATDSDIAEYITYPSPKGHGSVRGYLVRPANCGALFW